MSEYQWRDGDGKPIKFKACPRCGVDPLKVDDCGVPGNTECPYFGIGQEAYEKLLGDEDKLINDLDKEVTNKIYKN